MFVCKHSIMGSHGISFLLWSDPVYLRLLELKGNKIQQITAQ